MVKFNIKENKILMVIGSLIVIALLFKYTGFFGTIVFSSDYAYTTSSNCNADRTKLAYPGCSPCFQITESLMKCNDYWSIKSNVLNYVPCKGSYMPAGYRFSWIMIKELCPGDASSQYYYGYWNVGDWFFEPIPRQTVDTGSNAILWDCVSGSKVMSPYPACVDDSDCNKGKQWTAWTQKCVSLTCVPVAFPSVVINTVEPLLTKTINAGQTQMWETENIVITSGMPQTLKATFHIKAVSGSVNQTKDEVIVFKK